MSYMPKGFYMGRMEKKEDKFEGLFNRKQLADLEGETELKVTKISKKEKERLIKEQRRAGCGSTFHTPFDFSDY